MKHYDSDKFFAAVVRTKKEDGGYSRKELLLVTNDFSSAFLLLGKVITSLNEETDLVWEPEELEVGGGDEWRSLDQVWIDDGL